MLVGHVEILCAWSYCWSAALRSSLICWSRSSPLAGLRSRSKSGPATSRSDSRDDRADVAVVVLERVLCARVLAAVDEEDEQDEDEQDAAAEQRRAPDAHGLAVRGRAAARERRRAGGGRTRVRGSSSSSKKDKKVCPGWPRARRAASDMIKDMRRLGGKFLPASDVPCRGGAGSRAWKKARGAQPRKSCRRSPSAGLGPGSLPPGRAARQRRVRHGLAAHDERLDRPVAVKRVPPTGDEPERAQREALAAARLEHAGDRRAVRGRRDEDGALPRLRARRGPDARRPRARRRAVGPRRRPRRARARATRSPTRTRAASSTATSSRRT